MAVARVAVAMALVLGCVTPRALFAQETFTLDDVAFLTGCWAGRMGSLDMMEEWTTHRGGLMLGTTRYLRDGAVVDFEFARMEQDESGVTLWPYPRGVASEHGFPLIRAGADYVFENLEHDFPVRIVYVRVGEDGLEPRIEGRDGSGTGWTLSRVACPG